ncbi:MAG TPA: NYN domain-containing protein [Nocardioidaceae bacterium]|nr:NYN domain-containing protein [Nocardioidaceae bacterium]
MATVAHTSPGSLPDPVRHRVVALAADALGRLAADHVPAPLRRVASFAPARRARLAATQIATVLGTDDDFRERVATQVRIAVPELCRALDDGAPPAAADPVEVAAVAYLIRPPGWADLVERAGDVPERPAHSRSDEAVERLQRQLSDARGDARAARDKAREQLAAAKAENAELRRKLATTRQRTRDAEAARAAAAQDRETQVSALGALEAEARRLRNRISELEATSSASKRAARDERELATIRARLLLDTLLESAQGLRRELALPPVSGAPADAVESVSPGAAGTTGNARARGVDDPALLEELLALPRVHVIVDGYNVTKTAWEAAALETQRTRLMNGLAPVVARTRVEMTVVFDGADLVNPPPVAGPRGVRILFSPPGVIADQTIGELVAAEPQGRPVVVVSSDREVAEAAVRSGARAVASIAMVRLLTR